MLCTRLYTPGRELPSFQRSPAIIINHRVTSHEQFITEQITELLSNLHHNHSSFRFAITHSNLFPSSITLHYSRKKNFNSKSRSQWRCQSLQNRRDVVSRKKSRSRQVHSPPRRKPANAGRSRSKPLSITRAQNPAAPDIQSRGNENKKKKKKGAARGTAVRNTSRNAAEICNYNEESPRLTLLFIGRVGALAAINSCTEYVSRGAIGGEKPPCILALSSACLAYVLGCKVFVDSRVLVGDSGLSR